MKKMIVLIFTIIMFVATNKVEAEQKAEQRDDSKRHFPLISHAAAPLEILDEWGVIPKKSTVTLFV